MISLAYSLQFAVHLHEGCMPYKVIARDSFIDIVCGICKMINKTLVLLNVNRMFWYCLFVQYQTLKEHFTEKENVCVQTRRHLWYKRTVNSFAAKVQSLGQY